jgi:hypothetical protein
LGFPNALRKLLTKPSAIFSSKKKMPPATRKKGVVSSRFRKNAGIRDIFV